MVHRPRGVGLRLHRPCDRPIHFEGSHLSSSVVVVSFRPTEWLARCVDSVVSQADEVILVDNGSEGRTVSGYRRDVVKVVRLAENRGFASGVNAGVASARGDVVALLNDDAVAGENWLSSAERVLKDPEVAAVAPRIVLARRYGEIVLDDEAHFATGDNRRLGRKITSAMLNDTDVLSGLVGPGIHQLESGPLGELWRWTSGERCFYVPLAEELFSNDPPAIDGLTFLLNGEQVGIRRVVELVNSAGSYLRKDGYAGDCGADEPDNDRWNRERECFAVTGTALVTTAAVLARVGPLERSFFAYYEDIDWCWRARLHGYKVVYDPAATVRHVRGLTSGGTSASRTRFLAERNRILTLARCAPLPLALREARKKWSGGGDDGVAAILPRAFPEALSQRVKLRRGWKLKSREPFTRWAGVDVPEEV